MSFCFIQSYNSKNIFTKLRLHMISVVYDVGMRDLMMTK